MADNSINITLQVDGMDCSNCALSITKNLEKKGMKNVYVDFATGEATFILSDKSKLASAIDSIHQLGYKVTDNRFGSQTTGLSRLEKRFYFTLPFSVVLFFSHMIFKPDFFLNQPYTQLILCLPVFIIGILQFGKSAWGSLKLYVPNMDVLVFIGSSAAFIYSLLGIYIYNGMHLHNYLFFETTATIITLVLLGNVLE
nr:cation-translocating P-type ATPase [Bacteroidota bacterium]